MASPFPTKWLVGSVPIKEYGELLIPREARVSRKAKRQMLDSMLGCRTAPYTEASERAKWKASRCEPRCWEWRQNGDLTFKKHKRKFSWSYKHTIKKWSSYANTSQIELALFDPCQPAGCVACYFILYFFALHLQSYCHLFSHLNIFYLEQSKGHTVMDSLLFQVINTEQQVS